MANNLPPSPPPRKDQPEAGDDLASRQREKILGSGGSAGERLHGALDSGKLDLIARQILKKRGINIDPFPNTDQLVVLFLKEHDVEASPPAGTTSGDALSGAFFGAMGPAASFAGSHLRQQEKIAAMHEWTSWKQWAIGHADWPAFKERLKRDYDANQTLIHDALRSASFQADYTEYSTKKKKENENEIVLASIAAVLLAIGATVFSLVQNAMERRSGPSLDHANPGFYNKQ
jgi:hypothetical protein